LDTVSITLLRRRLIALASAGVLAVCWPAGSRAADLGGYIHRTQSAPYTFKNTILRLHFNVAKGVVYGDETLVLRLKHPMDVLPFHSHRIHYQRITVDGRNAVFTVDNTHDLVSVLLPSPAPAGAQRQIDFHYSAQPQRGMYFARTDKAYPNVIPEIWTQGEPSDNHWWFPTWDEPNEKTPSELIVTVPHGWAVVGNGLLKSHARNASTDTWDWDSPLPKSTYLIAFAAGPFERVPDHLGSLTVDGYVQPGSSALGARCFSRTPDMIAYYGHITGVPYPFEKYDQIATERFIFGGMEDTSNTILTDRALHPPIEETEKSCDGLVSHELAQQWYGDDATTVDWSNIWLNEGFATYYDELWTAVRFGTPDFEYARYNAQQKYFAETAQYMRPIVDYKYVDALQLFDASSHERPAQALHMLRVMFGDARFFRAVDDYLRTYAYRNADTHQFFAAIGKSLGTDLTWFQNEWFYRASYPHYYVTQRYDAAAHEVTLHVEQHNPDGKPFRMPITVEAFFGGRVVKREVMVDRADQSITIAGITAEPSMVLFDPDNEVLRKLTWAKTPTQLAYQMTRAEHVGDREWALQQLATVKGEDRSTASTAVASAVSSDSFWGIRADAVAVAASFNNASAIRRALHDSDARVRIAAEGAAGSLQGPQTIVAHELETMTSDANPDIAAAAFTALGTMRAPGAIERLAAALDRPSFHQTISIGALAGLAVDCNQRALALIEARTSYGTFEQERDAAVHALAQCALRVKDPGRALPRLISLAIGDPLISTRIAAVSALGTLHDRAAIPALERVERNDSQEIVREIATTALSSLRSP
jgi:aminopeptidase N